MHSGNGSVHAPGFTGGITGALGQTRDELADVVAQLRVVDEQRRRVLTKLVTAQEAERARIAGDIHDDSIQVMTAVGMRLETVRRVIANGEAELQLERLERSVRDAITRLRHLLFELHPPELDTEGIAAAVQQYIAVTEEDDGPVYRVEHTLREEPAQATRVVLYRIAQEALTNARKHSGAGTVEVRLGDHDGGYLLTVIDDGAGFDPGAPPCAGLQHVGLEAMRERAELAGGWHQVHSSPETGTTVITWLPAEHADAAGAGGAP